jgi:hypothetical protein
MAEYIILGGLFFAAYEILAKGTKGSKGHKGHKGHKRHVHGCKCAKCMSAMIILKESYSNHRRQYRDDEVLFNKVDWTDNNKPITGKIYLEPGIDIYQTNAKSNIEVVDAYGLPVDQALIAQQVANGQFGVSLNGEPINPKQFVHSNMIPFFGSKVRQNTDEGANEHKLDVYTGTSKNSIEKHEINPMFEPQKNLTNPYGAGNIYGYYKNRYIPSNKRTNEAPIPRINVGPGLNKGYTSEPSGGFQQADTRDYAMPLSTNEMRTLNNPKTTYMGRTAGGGSSISKRTIDPSVRPVEKDLTQDTGPGAYSIATAQIPSAFAPSRANLFARGQERDTDNERIGAGQVLIQGPAGATNYFASPVERDQIVLPPTKQEFGAAPLAVANMSGKWSI